jgi:hypothetical protein
MKSLALLVVVALTGCASAPPQPVTPSQQGRAESKDEYGSTNAQGSENPNRAMKHDECVELGEYMANVCHETHTRQARIEGWCSDVSSRVASGTFADDCVAHMKYMDSVCYRSNDNAMSMMACDRTAGE